VAVAAVLRAKAGADVNCTSACDALAGEAVGFALGAADGFLGFAVQWVLGLLLCPTNVTGAWVEGVFLGHASYPPYVWRGSFLVMEGSVVCFGCV